MSILQLHAILIGVRPHALHCITHIANPTLLTITIIIIASLGIMAYK